MKIIITNQMLSIVPYLSTHWSRIDSMHVRNDALMITLSSGETISIPNLSTEALEKIFTAHALYLERKTQDDSPEKTPPKREEGFSSETLSSWSELSKQFSRGLSGELWKNMSSMLQHDPEQAHAPDLPPEALSKMSMLAQMLGPQETSNLPEAEPHCNCYHCQMLRVLHGKEAHAEVVVQEEGEPVSDQELSFSEWEIVQTGEKLFRVTNRLDATESYNVFLGEPVGCTCGKRGCEHVLAVLKS